MSKLDRDWMTMPDGTKVPRPKREVQLPSEQQTSQRTSPKSQPISEVDELTCASSPNSQMFARNRRAGKESA